jgi:hypothetical protein
MLRGASTAGVDMRARNTDSTGPTRSSGIVHLREHNTIGSASKRTTSQSVPSSVADHAACTRPPQPSVGHGITVTVSTSNTSLYGAEITCGGFKAGRRPLGGSTAVPLLPTSLSMCAALRDRQVGRGKLLPERPAT